MLAINYTPKAKSTVSPPPLSLAWRIGLRIPVSAQQGHNSENKAHMWQWYSSDGFLLLTHSYIRICNAHWFASVQIYGRHRLADRYGEVRGWLSGSPDPTNPLQGWVTTPNPTLCIHLVVLLTWILTSLKGRSRVRHETEHKACACSWMRIKYINQATLLQKDCFN